MSTAIIILKNTKEYSNKFTAAFSSYRRCVTYMKQYVDDIMMDKSTRVEVSNYNGSLNLVVNAEEFQFDFLQVNLSDPYDFKFISTIADEIVAYVNNSYKNRSENHGNVS